MHAALLALPLALVLAAGQRELREYEKRRLSVQLECGARHLEYGLNLRRRGLTTPAAEQFFLAVEASDEQHEQAATVLRLLREREDGFWRRELERPSRAQLEGYARRAAALRREDRRQRLELVRWCDQRGLESQATRELQQVLLDLDQPLCFDPGGDLVLEGARLGGRLAERVGQDAIRINGQLYPRDRFLTDLGHVPELFECSSDELRVRTTTSLADARELHALGTALLPALEARNGARPSRRMQVVVLGRRREYEGYLDAVQLQRHRTADGFADRRCATAVLTSEGSDREHLLGLVLHELTHLYQLLLSPAVFPSWYLEGSAEASGGEGTFTWDGSTLVSGLPLATERLREIRRERLPLTPFLEGEALRLLGRDPDAARRFYAQSWAFVRFLETGLEPRHARLFQRWQDLCLGMALGADPKRPHSLDSSESLDLFFRLFEDDLERLDEAFGTWLEALVAGVEAR